MSTTESTNGALLSLRGIQKRFGPVQALSDVTLDIPAGKVTALCGDNGAGKSVTIKTIAGLWAPDGGQMIWEGKQILHNSPREAEQMGIKTIYQDLALCDNLDIVQNMFLGHEVLRNRLLDEDTMETRARQTLKELSRDHGPLDPPAGRVTVRRSAPVGRRRQGRDVQRKACDHGRAHGGARRHADAPGAGPDQAAR